jgi:hypothetical protein
MTSTRKLFIVVGLLLLLGLVSLLAFGGSYDCTRLALAEYFRPTTSELMPLSEDCVEVREQPSVKFLQIVRSQELAYNLTLQKIVSCKTQHQIPLAEPSFSQLMFDQETRNRWLPLYIGCCTYQFRRHFTVVAAQPSEGGFDVTRAALIQNRTDYFHFLTSHCSIKLGAWR